MLSINQEQLKQGLKVARKASCPISFHCLWGRPESVLEEEEEECEIVRFRKIFESESPALFDKFLKLSEYQRIIHTFNALEIEGSSLEQTRNSQEELQDLHLFVQVALLTLYPLFLANNEEIPFLLPKEINQEEEVFSKQQFDRVGEEMHNINSDWTEWIVSISQNFIQSEKYAKAISLLVRLFLKGVQKTQLPCLNSNQEKEEFFNEIEERAFSK